MKARFPVALGVGILVLAAAVGIAFYAIHLNHAPGMFLSRSKWNGPGELFFVGIRRAGDSGFTIVCPNERGGESAENMQDGQVTSAHDLSGFVPKNGGALFVHDNQPLLLSVVPDMPTELKLWRCGSGAWGKAAVVPCSVAGLTSLVSPHVVVLPNGEVDALCLVNGSPPPGLYAIQIEPEVGTWRRVRPGGMAYPLCGPGRPDSRFVYTTKRDWGIADLAAVDAPDLAGPTTIEGHGQMVGVPDVYGACADQRGNPWVCWDGQVKDLTGDHTFLSRYDHGKWASVVQPVRMFLSETTALLALPNGGVAVVGVDLDSGGLVCLEYSDDLKLRSNVQLINGKDLPGGKDTVIDSMAVSIGGDDSLNVVYQVVIPKWQVNEYRYVRFAASE